MGVLITAEVVCNGMNQCVSNPYMLGEAYTYVIPLAEYINALAFPTLSLINN